MERYSTVCNRGAGGMDYKGLVAMLKLSDREGSGASIHLRNQLQSIGFLSFCVLINKARQVKATLFI